MLVMTSCPLQGIFFHDFKNAHIPEILKEIYLDKIYEPYLIGKHDLVIADFGANIGLTSYYFKDFGKVYAVEPAKMHREAIEAMIKQNNIDNIVVCPYAISNKNGKTQFIHNENSTMFMLKDVGLMGKTGSEEVETVTVEEFMNRNKLDHIDLLKMDLEGAESEVITSEEFKSVMPKINLIIGEYHTWSSMGQKCFTTTMVDLGFNFRWLHTTEASVFIAEKI